MTEPGETYREISDVLGDALRAGPHNIGHDKAGGLNADFETRLESLANELEHGRWDGVDEARRVIALIRDVRSASQGLDAAPARLAAMMQLGELRMFFRGMADSLE